MSDLIPFTYPIQGYIILRGQKPIAVAREYEYADLIAEALAAKEPKVPFGIIWAGGYSIVEAGAE